MKLRIKKMHGSSNDIIMVEVPWKSVAMSFGIDSGGQGPANPPLMVENFVTKLCDRNGPFGADGVYFLNIDEHAHVEADFYNPDGSFAGMCGNGLRAVTRLAADQVGISSDSEQQVVITSDGSPFVGERSSAVPGVACTTVSTRSISFKAADLPIRSDSAEFIETTISESGTSLRFTAAAIPNDHVVTVVDEFDLEQFTFVGERLSVPNDALPNGANVSFVKELPKTGDLPEFFVRTYERGAGPTAACGSGQTASRAVLYRTGVAGGLGPALLRNVGGPGIIELKQAESNLYGLLTGNATYVYDAEVEVFADGSLEVATAPTINTEDIDRFESVFEANKTAIEAAGVEADFEAADNRGAS